MRRIVLGAALAVALAGCGGSGPVVPRGNPDSRLGAAAVDAYSQIELLRALLLASSDAYYAGGNAGEANTQLHRAKAAYEQLAPGVLKSDPVLAREVDLRFARVVRALRIGTSPDHYRDLTAPLGDQLMDGVAQALVSARARSDVGLKAEALRRIALRLSATYDAASAPADDTRSRLAFQEAWGLWRRSLALTTLVKPKLGDQKDTIAGALNDLRGPAFPEGPNPVDEPAADKVDKASATVVRALDDRFGLSGA